MKKLFILGLLAAATLSVGASLETPTTAKADEETIAVEPGVWTQFINTVSDGKFDPRCPQGMIDQSSEYVRRYIEDNILLTSQFGSDFEISEFNTNYMDALVANASDKFGTKIDHVLSQSQYELDGYTYYTQRLLSNHTYHYIEDMQFGYIQNEEIVAEFLDRIGNKTSETAYHENETLITFKMQPSLFFNDWEPNKEQPICFAFQPNYEWIEDFANIYIDNDFSIPLCKINGEDLVVYNYKVDGESTITHSENCRMYVGWNTPEDEFPISSKIFVEIPFSNFIETMEFTFADGRICPETYTGDNFDPDYINDDFDYWYVSYWLHEYLNFGGDFVRFMFAGEVLSQAQYCPILLDNIDIQRGTLDAISVVGERNRYILESITIDNEYIIDCDITIDSSMPMYSPLNNKDKFEDWWKESALNKRQSYIMTDDANERFNTKNSNHPFIKKLINSVEDINFNITSISYHITNGSTAPVSNLDTSDGLSVVEIHENNIKELDPKPDMTLAERAPGVPERLFENNQPRKVLRAVDDEPIDSTRIIDQPKGLYAFNYIAKENIHDGYFDSRTTNGDNHAFIRFLIGSNMAFSFYDNDINSRSYRLNALAFTYKYKKDFYTLSFTSHDILLQFESEGWSFITPVLYFRDIGKILTQVEKTDERTGITFRLRSMTHDDKRAGLLWGGSGKDFIITTSNTDIEYESILSAAFLEKPGTIINVCALSKNTGVRVPTKIIASDGAYYFINKNGEVLVKWTEDENGNLLDEYGNRVIGQTPNDDNGIDWPKIILGVIIGTMIVAGLYYGVNFLTNLKKLRD